jgi:hypothetical protein
MVRGHRRRVEQRFHVHDTFNFVLTTALNDRRELRVCTGRRLNGISCATTTFARTEVGQKEYRVGYPRSKRLEQALRDIGQEEALRAALAGLPPVADDSAWAAAVHVGLLRDRPAAAGINASVRRVGHLLGWSPGRVGDLLKIRDAFAQTAVDWIGLSRDRSEGESLEFSERGAQLLSRLSFRALRSATRLPFFQRCRKLRDLAQSTAPRV